MPTVVLVPEVSAGPEEKLYVFAGKTRDDKPGQDVVAAVEQVVHSQSLEMDHSRELEVLLVHNQVRILDHHTHILDLQILQWVQLDQIRSQT